MLSAARVGENQTSGDAYARRTLLTATGVGLILGGPLLARLAGARAASQAHDVQVLRLVLLVEHTQVAFYSEALRRAKLRGELREFATVALGHERAHLAAITTALGGRAGRVPTFDFAGRTSDAAAFRKTAIELEETAVRGYNGQAANVTRPTLAAAAKIVSVEARHAAWVRAIAGETAAPEAVDEPLSAAAVARRLRAIGLKA